MTAAYEDLDRELDSLLHDMEANDPVVATTPVGIDSGEYDISKVGMIRTWMQYGLAKAEPGPTCQVRKTIATN